jgi:hypothetical protein
MKKLPIGIQTFSEIIEENYIYIDKTKLAIELVNNHKFVFLSRPRRFGKSLFVDTLQELFEGNKPLFKNLYAYNNWNFEKKYPVIKISWSGDFRTLDSTKIQAYDVLKRNQKRLGIECELPHNPSSCLRELIKKSYEKYNQKVVVLIDEYDKPILDNIDNLEVAKETKEFIKGFYSVLKDSDRYLKFVFLTGVSKFSKVSIFSGLNNIEDISLNPNYGDICGYTQKDVETSFKEHLKDSNLENVKKWYNGYNFLGEKVYNPFDVLLFIRNNLVFKNYWFETGTPTYLIKLLKEKNYFIPELENLVVGEELINSFDIEDIKLETILFQAGYLTIDKMKIDFRNTPKYSLKVPNLEIQISFNDILIDYLTDNSEKYFYQTKIFETLSSKNIKKLEEVLTSLFASIPYNNFTNNNMQNYEGYYASVIYAYFASLGVDIIAEDVTNLGRIDLTLIIRDKIYIIEFKVGEENALNQIKQKEYHKKYLSENKEIILIGINFDKEKRNVSRVEFEEIK